MGAVGQPDRGGYPRDFLDDAMLEIADLVALYSSSTVMPYGPAAPSLGHRSRGNWLLRSISAARGAISLLEKSCTVSQIASAVFAEIED